RKRLAASEKSRKRLHLKDVTWVKSYGNYITRKACRYGEWRRRNHLVRSPAILRTGAIQNQFRGHRSGLLSQLDQVRREESCDDVQESGRRVGLRSLRSSEPRVDGRL